MKGTNVQNRKHQYYAKTIFPMCHLRDVCGGATPCVLYSPIMSADAQELARHPAPPPHFTKDK